MTASEIGAELSRARAANGLTLDELSQRTKIKTHTLKLIEQGELAQLPSIVFMRNFVRQYASNVALDPEPLLASLPQLDDSMRQLPAPPVHPRKKENSWRNGWRGIPHSKPHSAWVMAIPVLLIGIGISAWFYYRPRFSEFHWPHMNAASVPRGAQQTPRVAEALRTVTPAPTAADAAGKDTQTQARAASEPEADQVAAAAPATQPVQVVVRALNSTWVQVVVDGETAFVGTLQANESREVKGAEKVKIVAGKQGSLEVSLNGKRFGPMKPSDQIRVVTLTAAGPEPGLPVLTPAGGSDQL